MIYTCYEMVSDCRAGAPAGWMYFISQVCAGHPKNCGALYAGAFGGPGAFGAHSAGRPQARILPVHLHACRRRSAGSWVQLRQLIVGELEAPAAEISYWAGNSDGGARAADDDREAGCVAGDDALSGGAGGTDATSIARYRGEGTRARRGTDPRPRGFVAAYAAHRKWSGSGTGGGRRHRWRIACRPRRSWM